MPNRRILDALRAEAEEHIQAVVRRRNDLVEQVPIPPEDPAPAGMQMAWEDEIEDQIRAEDLLDELPVVGNLGEDIDPRPVNNDPPQPVPVFRRAAQIDADFIRMHFDGGRRRGGRVVMDGLAEIPANVLEEPRPLPKIPPMRKPAVKKVRPTNHVYPEEGVMYNGRRYSRELTYAEASYLGNYGNAECMRKYPDLVYKEKEKPIDDNEECIVLMSELADFYATQDCKRSIENFDLKTHNTEYQMAYKKHLKVISDFKRNKHG